MMDDDDDTPGFGLSEDEREQMDSEVPALGNQQLYLFSLHLM